MKRTLHALSILLLGALLMGAMPVSLTSDRFINDSASMLSEEDYTRIVIVARDLYAQTGIQAAVLTVEGMGGREPGEYVQTVVADWELGGPDGENGILLLVSRAEKQSILFMGGQLEDLGIGDTSVNFGRNKLSPSIANVYLRVARDAYEKRGVTPNETIQAIFDTALAGSGPFSTGVILFFAVILLAFSRSVRVSRKYRQRFLTGNVRKTKTYTRNYNEEDQYKNEDIYKITYDDAD